MTSQSTLDNRIQKLVDLLVARTLTGDIHWVETAKLNTFLCGFPKGSVGIALNPYNIFWLTVHSSRGSEATTWQTGPVNVEPLKELYRAAKQSAIRPDETVEGIIESLEAVTTPGLLEERDANGGRSGNHDSDEQAKTPEHSLEGF